MSSSDPSGLCDRCDGGGGQVKPKKHHHSSHGGSTSTSSGNTSASPAPSTTPTPSLGPAPSSTQTPTPTLGEVPCQPADFGTNRCGSYGGGKLFLAAVGLPAAAAVAGGVFMCVDTGVVDCIAGLAMGAADAEAGGSLLAGTRVIVGLGSAAAETIEEADELAAEASAAKQATEDAAAARGAAAKKADAQAQAEHANTEAAAPDTPSKGESTSTAKEACSFSPDTPVLMDHGKATPIGKIKTGDKVEAADPKTGKHQGARTVQHVWINHDRDLLDLTLRTKDGHTATLHTTANHPFWDDTTHTWVAAAKLHHGDALNTPTNGHAYVVNTQPMPGAANRWNLTVQQLHTYYVVAGGIPILVHNTGTGPNRCSVSGPAHVQSRVDDLTDAAGAGAGFRTMGGLHADVPESSGGLDFYAVGARADLTPAQFGELPDLGNTEFGFRVPQPAKTVAKEDLWHAEVKLFNEAAGVLQLQPRFLVVSRPICPACEDFLINRGATLTSATTAEW